MSSFWPISEVYADTGVLNTVVDEDFVTTYNRVRDSIVLESLVACCTQFYSIRTVVPYGAI